MPFASAEQMSELAHGRQNFCETAPLGSAMLSVLLLFSSGKMDSNSWTLCRRVWAFPQTLIFNPGVVVYSDGR
jgi:hypothetical protein